MGSNKLIVGVNDLQSQFPELASEAYEWDPGTITAKSSQKKRWKCNEGHIYHSTVANRTNRGDRCVICSGRQVLAGFNDLKTKFPDIAAEAYGWDPSTVVAGTGQKKDWKCKEGHIYTSSVISRTRGETGCPFCANQQVLIGFNDLQSQFPDIAEEAFGWYPSTVTKSSGQKKDWKCKEGHIYSSSVASRKKGSGCPFCANQQVLAGFNDLQSQFPNIASEAYGWDPTTVTKASDKKKEWKCDKGHIYKSAVKNRTNGRGCAVCSGHQVLAGFNDLQTKFPDIAADAYGWDPTTITSASNKKRDWKCKEGHIYSSSVANRTISETGCAVCSGRQVLAGFNDLKTKFPDIAAEAYEWDPSTVVGGTNQKKDWKCKEGHIYHSLVSSRTSNESGCPFCSGFKILAGFNDLQTKFPDIAAEAYGWDPSTVVAGTGQKKEWVCNKGHIYSSSVANRTSSGNGCPTCAETGFSPDKDAWFYLMERPGEQQLGISNIITDRLRKHERNGWTTLEHTSVPSRGQKVLDTENAFKKWLKKEIGLMEGTTENWSTTKMEVQSLAELKARSGIETDLF